MKTKNLPLVIACLFGLFAAPLHGQWKQCNGPYGGDVTSFAVSGANIFAGTARGGVYRSENNGATWSATSTEVDGRELMSRSLLCLLIKGTKIFAGTTSDLYVSENNGGNWSKVTDLRHGPVYSIAAIQDTILLMGTANDGIHRSTDAGVTWSKILNDFDDLSVYALVVRDSIILAGTSNGKVYRSEDNGNNWNKIYDSVNSNKVRSLLLVGETIIVGTDIGIVRSADFGKTWANSTISVGYTGVSSFARQGGVLLAGTTKGVLISTDNGANWVETSLKNKDIMKLFSKDSIVYASIYPSAGIYRTVDNGKTWTEANTGIRSLYVSSLVSLGSTLFAGSFGGKGIYRSDDNGETWYCNNLTLDYQKMWSLTAVGSTLYAGTGRGLFRSTDSAKSWTAMGLNKFEVYSLLSIGSDLYAGTNGGFHKSSDSGSTWVRIDSNMVFSGMRVGVHALSSLGSTIVAGTNFGIIYSPDNGANWFRSSPRPPDNTVGCFAVYGSIIYAGLNAAEGVYQSIDTGKSWSPVSSGFSEPYIKSIAQSGTILFAADLWRGVYYSDNGRKWERIGQELPYQNVNSVVVNGSTLFAGIGGAGIWKYDISTLSTDQESNNPMPHLTCSPNPSTTTVTINCSSLAFNPALPVHYTITSLTGSALLEFERIESRFTIPTDDLGSGVYYVVARQGVVRSAAMMSVVR